MQVIRTPCCEKEWVCYHLSVAYTATLEEEKYGEGVERKVHTQQSTKSTKLLRAREYYINKKENTTVFSTKTTCNTRIKK